MAFFRATEIALVLWVLPIRDLAENALMSVIVLMFESTHRPSESFTAVFALKTRREVNIHVTSQRPYIAAFDLAATIKARGTFALGSRSLIAF